MNPFKTLAAWGAEKLVHGASFVRALTGWRRWLAAFLAGVSAALAMAPVYALPLMVLGFSVLVTLLDASAELQRPRRSAFSVGWFFGFGYFLIGIYWMALSFFVQADQFAWMSPFAVFGMPAFLALFYGGACVVSISLWRKEWARIFLFALVLSVFEYARGHILTGLPWNLPGQSLAGSVIGAQTAAWWGVYGLTLIVIFLSAAPAANIGAQRIRYILSGSAVTVCGFVALFLVGAVRLATPEPETDGQMLVRIVQPNIPQREKIDWNMWTRNFERQLEHSTAPIPPDATVFIVWPENGAPLLSEAEASIARLAEDLPTRSVLIAGAVRREILSPEESNYFNSIAILERAGGNLVVTDNYDKHHLVPFGEYLPFYDLLNAVGLAQLTPYGDAGFTKGAGPRTIRAGGSSFAPMVCYEAIFPGASYPKQDRPDWLVTVTNDAWYGDSSGPRQHLDMARLRSIEAGLPMARSANTGVSALIDGKGRMLGRLPLYRAGKIEAPLPPPLSPTLYAKVGDWAFWLLACLFASAAIMLRNKIAP